ncbi:cob(I)yrinic acid a,c-diamide adenosyltransferase [Selenomonas sp. TAMA-11512]|uniref:cob(I)yrinic acid a,c-diamide adenosyltransferase n=1 Tax=Selenomonas sp. TAMA-11512 TaxID=3095337 RepID=UPI003086EB8A|nr:cob(I)yrinic acid a,c-diamide adenosyltransferase [Selenomonas sp. TAMA-11512]
MSITTKTGDGGETSLYTGERVGKNSLRVEAYGTVDEAGSALAMARAFSKKDEVKEKILSLQKSLSLLMADLASLNKPAMVDDAEVQSIEKDIQELENRLPKLTAFLIPGDSPCGAMLDLARTILRKAERRVLDLAEKEAVHTSNRRYLNRLSDYCFLLMRLEEQ